MKVNLRLWQGARPRWAGVQCEKTEAAIQKPIAAPAWPRYGTRPPFTNLCDLRAVRAAGGGFRRRRGAPCAGRCTLGRLFGLRGAARPRARRYAIAHGIRDKVHVKSLAVQPHMCKETINSRSTGRKKKFVLFEKYLNFYPDKLCHLHSGLHRESVSGWGGFSLEGFDRVLYCKFKFRIGIL